MKILLGRKKLIFFVLVFFGCQVKKQDIEKIEHSQFQLQVTDPCRDSMEYELFSIEDFEQGIGTKWWVSSDGTGKMYPLPGREPEAVALEGGRCGVSGYALKIEAKGLLKYGGGIGVNFNSGFVDASSYDGVAFFAKRGANSGKSLFFALSETTTDQEGSKIVSLDKKPFCLEVTNDESQKCDRFGKEIDLETRWQFYTINFNEFAQKGFGKKAENLDKTKLLGLNISFGTGDWEIWVDDISFYKK